MSDRDRDEVKGRAKEAAGDLTGDKKIKREGKVDRGSATAKEKIDKVTDAVKDKLDRDERRR